MLKRKTLIVQIHIYVGQDYQICNNIRTVDLRSVRQQAFFLLCLTVFIFFNNTNEQYR